MEDIVTNNWEASPFKPNEIIEHERLKGIKRKPTNVTVDSLKTNSIVSHHSLSKYPKKSTLTIRTIKKFLKN